MIPAARSAGAPLTRATRPLVVKLGGRALERPESTRELAVDLARLTGAIVLVHGGGAEVSDWCTRLGIEPRFARGLRVTDPPTMDVVTAVLAGLANKRLVARLRAAGLDAVGLAALDGGLIDVAPHPEAATLGAVGEVRGVHPNLLEVLLNEGRVPVLASIAAEGDRLMNVNADDLASAIAAALGASALVLFSDVPGLTLEGRIVEHLDVSDLKSVLARSDVTGGMAPKLAAARAALERGVPRVSIAGWGGPGTLEAVLSERDGTQITRGATEAGRV